MAGGDVSLTYVTDNTHQQQQQQDETTEDVVAKTQQLLADGSISEVECIAIIKAHQQRFVLGRRDSGGSGGEDTTALIAAALELAENAADQQQ